MELFQVDVASEDSISAAAKTVDSKHGRYASAQVVLSFC